MNLPRPGCEACRGHGGVQGDDVNTDINRPDPQICLPPRCSDMPACLLYTGLGVQLVVVTGVQDLVDQMLRERNLVPKYMGGYRITDRDTMKVTVEAGGEVRTHCEQSLSKVRPDQASWPWLWSPDFVWCPVT